MTTSRRSTRASTAERTVGTTKVRDLRQRRTLRSCPHLTRHGRLTRANGALCIADVHVHLLTECPHQGQLVWRAHGCRESPSQLSAVDRGNQQADPRADDVAHWGRVLVLFP